MRRKKHPPAGAGAGETGAGGLDLKKVAGGLLLQTMDREPVGRAGSRVVTERAPTEEEWRQLIFAQKVVKHVKSNAIVIAREGRTVGIGAGQMSRIAAAKIALAQAGEKAAGAVLGSDAFFPFPCTVDGGRSRGHGDHPAGRVAAGRGLHCRLQPLRAGHGLYRPALF